MAVTTAVLTGNVTDLTGTADTTALRSARLAIESSTTDSALLDTAGNKVMVGLEQATIDTTTGAFSKTLVRTDSADIVPAAGRMYRAHLRYTSKRPDGSSEAKTLTSGWFTLTADSTLASKWTGIEAVSVPATANLNDVAMTNVDASAASAFRVQQDARQAAPKWAAAQAVVVGTVRQAPDGSWIKSTAARTTGATFDATEQTFWTAVAVTAGTIEQTALSATYGAMVSPLTYGAVGDNVADDTTPLQSAITAAAPLGRPVDLMGRTYKITAALNLPTGTTLRNGAIRQTVNTYALRATTTNNITIDGITVTGFGATSTADQGAIHITGGTRIRILNTRVTTNKVGVWITGCSDVLVQGCEIDTFKTYGLVLSQSNYWRVIGNSIHGSTETGAANSYCITATGNMPTASQKGCTIIGNHLYDVPSWDAIMTHETADLTIADNWIQNVRNGIDIGPNGGTPFNGRITITGNVIQGTTTDTWAAANAINSGILAVGDATSYVERLTITGNVIEHFNYFPSATGAGGVLLSTVRDVTVTGNVIRDIGNAVSYMGGVSLLGQLRGVTISGNECADTAYAGVAFYNVPRGEAVNIAGNTFRKDVSATMTFGVNVDSARTLNSRISGNIAHKIAHITRSGTLYLPVMPLSEHLGAGQLADPHPYRDAIAPVGSTQGGDTLGAGLRYVTFRLDTTTNASAAAGVTALPVTTNAGVAASDTLYVVLDDASWHGTNVTGTAAGVINMTSAIPAGRSVANGAEVWVVRWVNGVSTGTPLALVGCKVTLSADQAIAGALAADDVEWGTEKWDTHGFHSGTNATLVVPAGMAGYYAVTASIVTATALDTDSRFVALILRNNSETVARSESYGTATTADYSGTSLAGEVYLAVGDNVRVQLFSTTAINIASASSSFTLRRVGT